MVDFKVERYLYGVVVFYVCGFLLVSLCPFGVFFIVASCSVAPLCPSDISPQEGKDCSGLLHYFFLTTARNLSPLEGKCPKDKGELLISMLNKNCVNY